MISRGREETRSNKCKIHNYLVPCTLTERGFAAYKKNWKSSSTCYAAHLYETSANPLYSGL